MCRIGSCALLVTKIKYVSQLANHQFCCENARVIVRITRWWKECEMCAEAPDARTTIIRTLPGLCIRIVFMERHRAATYNVIC